MLMIATATYTLGNWEDPEVKLWRILVGELPLLIEFLGREEIFQGE